MSAVTLFTEKNEARRIVQRANLNRAKNAQRKLYMFVNETVSATSPVVESAKTIKAEVAAQETTLNQFLESLKSKNISKEEHERLLAEAYPTAVALLDKKIEMGKELLAIEPAKGQRTDLAFDKSKVSKKALYTALGLTRTQSDDYQFIANNLKYVEQAKLGAKENKCVPTVYQVKKFIKLAKKEEKKAATKLQEGTTANDNATLAVSNETPKTSGNVAPQYFSTFANNMKCAELPDNKTLEDFVSTTVEMLNENNTYTGKTYIYFEASQDKLLEYLTKIKEMTDVAQTGICIRH